MPIIHKEGHDFDVASFTETLFLAEKERMIRLDCSLQFRSKLRRYSALTSLRGNDHIIASKVVPRNFVLVCSGVFLSKKRKEGK